MEFLSWYSIVGPLMGLLVSGYLCAYMVKVIRATAGGEDQPPDWPDVTEFWDDIFRPILLVVGTGLVSFLPVLMVGLFVDPVEPILRLVLVGVGMVYFPMGLTAVALFDSLQALDPRVVVRGIVRSSPSYFFAVITFFAVSYVSADLQTRVFQTMPRFGTLLAWVASVYFLLVEMAILGLVYRRNEQRLGWFT